MTNELERHARATTDAWKAARDIIATVYPNVVYNFGQAGPSLDIQLNATTGLAFGVCDVMIGANIDDIVGDQWEPTTEVLDTPLSSDSEDGVAIAAAILKATLDYHHDIRDGFDNSAPGEGAR